MAARVERAVVATAPARVGLAGGSLDVWPLYLLHPGAVTLDVAIDRRAWCRVAPCAEGVRIESKEVLRRVEGDTVAELLERERPPLAAFVLDALGVRDRVEVATRTRVPEGSGLGEASAIAVATAAATAAAAGRELPAAELGALVRDAEARWRERPTGTRGVLAAIHGGVIALHLEPGTPRVEKLPVDAAALEECVLLASSGAPRSSVDDDWAVLRARVEGEADARRWLGEIARAGASLAGALREGRLGEVPRLIAAEWEAQKRLTPGLGSPEIDRLAALAAECGGAAWRCGGGGVVAFWAAPGERGPGPRERLEPALKEAGIAAFPFRTDLQGLEVELE